jgi:hypothetical protein
MRYIDFALHKTGVGAFSGERYLVSSQIREELERTQLTPISALSTPLQESELNRGETEAAQSTDTAGNVVSRRSSI